MKFFADEHVPVPALQQLRVLLPDHGFDDQHADHGLARGADDNTLIQLVSERYDALITNDKSQLNKHRAALMAQDLHWIGIPENPGGGARGINYLVSTLLLGIPEFLQCVADNQRPAPIWVSLNGLPRKRSQLLTLRAPERDGRKVKESEWADYFAGQVAMTRAS